MCSQRGYIRNAGGSRSGNWRHCIVSRRGLAVKDVVEVLLKQMLLILQLTRESFAVKFPLLLKPLQLAVLRWERLWLPRPGWHVRITVSTSSDIHRGNRAKRSM